MGEKTLEDLNIGERQERASTKAENNDLARKAQYIYTERYTTLIKENIKDTIDMNKNMASHIKRLGKGLTVLLMAAAPLVSCDNQIFDYEEDCSVTYQVKFKYDMNMKYADAFAHEVTSVNLYAFDPETGSLVYSKSESGEALAHDGYVMTLDLEPGEYDLLAWCGDALEECKCRIPESAAATRLADMSCTVERKNDAQHPSCIDEDIRRLFHGKKRVKLSAEPGVYTDTLSLTKNTNVVRVILQESSGEDVDPEKYDIRITDRNGMMAYDNTICDNTALTYHPWNVQAIKAGTDIDINNPHNAPATRGTTTSVSATFAELTVSRLVIENEPVLTVYNRETGATVLSIPFKDYALMIKGNYNRHMSDQEYLDRQDEYNMTFFLNQGKWLAASVIINSWHVVLQNSGIK